MFTEALRLDLTLAIGNDVFKIAGGNIKAARVAIRSYGFEAELTFWVAAGEAETDKVFAGFTTSDLAKATLSVKGVFNIPTPAPDALVVVGIVTRKSFVEIATADVSGQAVNQRQYRIHFADAARVLWGQHYPCDLIVGATFQDLLDAHKPAGLELSYDWDALGTTWPIIRIGLGAGDRPASFHDFVCWLVRTDDGVLTFDHATGTLALSGQKAAASGLPSFLVNEEVESLSIASPEVARHSVALDNADAVKAATTTIDSAVAVTGVTRSILIRTPLADEVDARKTLETGRLVPRGPEVVVSFKSFPTVTLRQGSMVRFEKGTWSKRISVQGKSWRARDLDLDVKAVNPAPTTDQNEPFTSYQTEMRVRCEAEAEHFVDLPPFRAPRWPIYVEGKIVAASATGVKTYQVVDDPKTGLRSYVVNVPLWNKLVPTPFLPDTLPSHFYFPAYKDQRVLLELGLHAARLTRFLDWGERTQIPEDQQGDNLLLGKSASSETAIKHVYTDSKPVLTVKRVSGQDLQTIEVSEGMIALEAKEDSTAPAGATTYDVTLEVASAKGDLATGVGGSIADVTAKFTIAEGAIGGAIGGASAAVAAKLDDMSSAIDDKIDETKGKIEALGAELSGSLAALTAGGAAASAEIKALAT